MKKIHNSYAVLCSLTAIPATVALFMAMVLGKGREPLGSLVTLVGKDHAKQVQAILLLGGVVLGTTAVALALAAFAFSPETGLFAHKESSEKNSKADGA